jgi:hypothetical protein
MFVLGVKDTIDKSKLTVLPPVKQKNKTRTMDVLYDGAPMIFKTPRLKINKETGELYFNIKNKPGFVDFLASIEDAIVSAVSSNSQTLFNGRLFSIEGVSSRMERFWDISDGPTAFIKPAGYDTDKIVYVDAFGEKATLDDIKSNVSALVEVKELLFTNNLFKIQPTIRQIKMSRFETSVSGFEAQQPEVYENKSVENPAQEENNQPTLEEDTGDFFID